MKEITLGSLCNPSTGQIQMNHEDIIDYIDISSVNNETKKITGYSTMAFAEAPSRARKRIKENNILVSTVRPNLNAVAIFDKSTPNIPVASTGFSVLDCKDNVDPRFVYHYCKSEKFIGQMVAQATGASYPAVNDGIVRSALLPFYDLGEQQRISNLLDRIEEIIQSRKKQLQSLDTLIKARFVELFGNGHDGKCLTAMMGEICKYQQGTQIPVEDQIDEPKPGYKRFLRIIDYTQAPQPPRFVNVDGREIDDKSVVIVRYGATAGFVGRGYAGILANNLFEIVPNETILSKDFLFLALKHGTFERDIHEKAFGAAMPALSFSMINDIPLVVPSQEAQKQFVSFVSQIDKSKAVVQQALAKDQLLFDSLMQQYFG